MWELPRNTRDSIRYLGDYIDLLVKGSAFEKLDGKSRSRSLGANAQALQKQSPELNSLSSKLKKFSDAIYTPGKHDFSLPPGRQHRFTAKEVVLASFIAAKLGKEILAVSPIAQEAVKADNWYMIGGRWGSGSRVLFDGHWNIRAGGQKAGEL